MHFFHMDNEVPIRENPLGCSQICWTCPAEADLLSYLHSIKHGELLHNTIQPT